MSKTFRKVAIVGGGVGGLALATGLRGAGFETELFESGPALRRYGGGLGIGANGMKVLELLGLAARVHACSRPIRRGMVADERLRRLMQFPENGFGVSILRKDLLGVLAEGAGDVPVRYEKQLTRCEILPRGGVELSFADGVQVEADAVIGCDGIHSVVRAAVAPTTRMRFAYQNYWAGLSTYSPPASHDWDFCEMWGLGLKFGIVRMAGDQTYWFAERTALHEDEARAPIDRAEIEALFSGFAEPVASLLRATEVDTIFRTNAIDLTPSDGVWHRGSACLLGDAAHATTPNLAQGANQALEDAAALARCLRRDPTAAAFDAFRRVRVEKVKGVVAESWKMGKVALWSPPFTHVRNALMRIVPARVLEQSFEKMHDTSYLSQL